MRRLALFGLLLALPLVAVPLVGAAAGGSSEKESLAEFRALSRPTPERVLPPVVAVAATPSRVSFLVTRPTGVEVAIHDGHGGLVRRLGHFTVPVRKRLTLVWDGASAPAGSVAVVTAAGRSVRAPVRRLAGAHDADRQPVREPGRS